MAELTGNTSTVINEVVFKSREAIAAAIEEMLGQAHVAQLHLAMETNHEDGGVRVLGGTVIHTAASSPLKVVEDSEGS